MLPRVFGHRGVRGSGNPPENSLSAFAAAMSQGAQGVELDLFLTKDKKLVIFHDDDLQRMTGIQGSVVDRTLEELQQTPLLNPDGGVSSDTIPSFAQLLDLIEHARSVPGPEKRRLDAFIVNAEIKGTGIARHLAAEIAARITRGWAKDHFQVSSFDIQSLREMKKAMPEITRGALFAGPIGAPRKPLDVTFVELAHVLETIGDIAPESVNLTLPSLMAQGGEAAHLIRQAGMRPVAWTCDEQNPFSEVTLTEQGRHEAIFLVEHGIDLITDFVRQRLESYQGLTA